MSENSAVGLVAITGDPTPIRRVLARIGNPPGATIRGVHLATWGLGGHIPREDSPLLLTTTNRSDGARVPPETIGRWLAEGDLPRLRAMLPPFAALGVTGDALRLSTDGFGFRPIFRAESNGWSAVSTSALLLSQLLGGGFDESGVLLQSQLGWQLGQRTLFEGVSVLAAGESLVLDADGIRSETPHEPRPAVASLTLAGGVQRAAQGLREFMEHYLDDTEDPTIQLTGGQDSRIVLSAIPRSRRRGLRAMTLHAPGSRDSEVAAQIAASYGMRHEVRSAEGLAALSAEDWYRRVLRTARHYECMTDPIARSITGWVEQHFTQGERLCGLGGEVARGFYYMGRVNPSPVTPERASTLAKWRMLANEAVHPDALHPRWRERAMPVSLEIITDVLRAADDEWFTATDELYLHRMRRWAGLCETAVTFRRSLTNPMLDHVFVDVAHRLSPRDKAGALFLGRVQLALDDDLARLPLDDRPAPLAYAHPGPSARFQTLRSKSTKLGAKALQRLRRAHRPPPGGAVVAGKLAEYFRSAGQTLDPARESGFFDERWLDGIVDGTVAPSPASLALLMNVLAASGARSE